MNEGLMKNTSITAIAVAAGFMLSMGSAFAADLGGNCCADLEERVAELEATAVKKGTRKTSLELYGSVNRIVVAWDDGSNRNTNLGADNVNLSSRFGLRGNAKFMSELTAGYSIVIEQASGARSTNISQFNDKKAVTGVSNSASFGGQFGANDAAITMREANWWIESSRLGRMTVGRFINPAGPAGQIDLAGIGAGAASGSMSLIGSGMVFRTNATPNFLGGTNPNGTNNPPGPVGNYSAYSIANTTDAAGEYSTRENGVNWTSPVWAGFSLAASYGGVISADTQCVTNALCTNNENYGSQWGLAGKYANEFGGLRLAASIGYEESNSENNTSMVAVNGTSLRPRSSDLGFSLALLHVPTGLFAQGFYNEYVRGHDLFTAAGAASTYSVNGTTSDKAKQFQIQLGLSKNWFGIGNTSPYIEYAQTKNGFNTFGLEAAGSILVNTVIAAPGGAAVQYFGDVTTNKMYGLGIVQNLDAAAMQLYAGYRQFKLQSDNCTAAGGCKDIGMFTTGARISF